MQLIIFQSESDNVKQVIVPDDADMEILMQLVQLETGVPLQQQHLECDGHALTFGSLSSQGVVDGCAITLSTRQQRPRSDASNASQDSGAAVPTPAATSTTSSSATENPEHQTAQPAPQPVTAPAPANNETVNLNSMSYMEFLNLNPENVVELAKANPITMVQLKRLDEKEFGEYLEAGDVGKVRLWMMKKMMSMHKESYEKKQEMLQLAMADPMDPEVQRKIAEKIRLENVEESRYAAMENLPESFAPVTMLYVKIQINSVPVKAFVDSGAQVTIISKRLAEQCGIVRLIDERFAGQMRGVGTSMSLGRIHTCQMRFGSSFILFSATVMEGNDIDFLFGLDNLRRLRGVIDLQRNRLVLDGAGESGREEEEFLGEAEVPKNSFAGVVDPAEKKEWGSGESGGEDNGGGGKLSANDSSSSNSSSSSGCGTSGSGDTSGSSSSN